MMQEVGYRNHNVQSNHIAIMHAYAEWLEFPGGGGGGGGAGNQWLVWSGILHCSLWFVQTINSQVQILVD